MVTIRTRFRAELLAFAPAMVVLSAACAGLDSEQQAQNPNIRRQGYLAEAQWEVTTGSEVLLPTQGTSLGAGHGLATFFFSSPCEHGEVLLAAPKSGGAGGPCPDISRPASFVNPLGDVVYIGPNSDVWWLGLPRGAVIAHPYKGNRVVTRLPTIGRVLAACSRRMARHRSGAARYCRATRDGQRPWMRPWRACT